MNMLERLRNDVEMMNLATLEEAPPGEVRVLIPMSDIESLLDFVKCTRIIVETQPLVDMPIMIEAELDVLEGRE